MRWSGIKYLDLRWDCSAMDSLVAVSETVATFDPIDGEQDSGTVTGRIHPSLGCFVGAGMIRKTTLANVWNSPPFDIDWIVV